MTACIVSGATFAHRELLKHYGGRWDNDGKHWTFDDLSDERIGILRKLVGVTVNSIEREVRAIWGARPERPREPTVCYGDDTTYFNHFADQNPPAFFGFSSLRRFVDYVGGLRPIGQEPFQRNSRHQAWSTEEDRAIKTGTPSMEEALRLAREGWSDGLGITDLIKPPKAQQKRRQRSVAGGSVSVGRMLAGNPSHMLKRTRLPGHRIITLFVECGMWRGITPWNATLRAWLIVAMCDALEVEGYRCEIVALDTALDDNNHDPGYQIAVHLKNAGDRLNLSDVSFALGHPSFSRRLCFAVVASADACRDSWIHMGCISEAFTDDHPCARNEFYIPQLFPHQQKQLNDNDPFDMLRFIQPDGLPVKLLEQQ